MRENNRRQKRAPSCRVEGPRYCLCMYCTYNSAAVGAGVGAGPKAASTKKQGEREFKLFSTVVQTVAYCTYLSYIRLLYGVAHAELPEVVVAVAPWLNCSNYFIGKSTIPPYCPPCLQRFVWIGSPGLPGLTLSTSSSETPYKIFSSMLVLSIHACLESARCLPHFFPWTGGGPSAIAWVQFIIQMQ